MKNKFNSSSKLMCEKLIKISLTTSHKKQCTYKLITDAHLCNHCSCGAAGSVSCLECGSVALDIQHAM